MRDKKRRLTMSTTESSTEPLLFPFNDLPFELQREIFLIAVEAQPFRLSSLFRLVLVAHRVKEWLQPLIYDMVTLVARSWHTRDKIDSFVRTMESMPPDFIAINVKRLCLTQTVWGSTAAHIIRFCTGVVDLALFWDQHVPEFSLSPISLLPLRRLSIELSRYRTLVRESAAWCETLTHLDLFSSLETVPEEIPIIPYLDKLPSLSHLLLHFQLNRDKENSLLAILSACKALKILVIHVGSDYTEDVLAVDPRVVQIGYFYGSWVSDWKYRAESDRMGAWSRAEALVKKQKHAAQRQG